MTFIWPLLLWTATLPLLVLGYVWLLRRRKKNAVAFANLHWCGRPLQRPLDMEAPSRRR